MKRKCFQAFCNKLFCVAGFVNVYCKLARVNTFVTAVLDYISSLESLFLEPPKKLRNHLLSIYILLENLFYKIRQPTLAITMIYALYRSNALSSVIRTSKLLEKLVVDINNTRRRLYPHQARRCH